MGKNIGPPSFQWKLKHDCQANHSHDSCAGENYLRDDRGITRPFWCFDSSIRRNELSEFLSLINLRRNTITLSSLTSPNLMNKMRFLVV